MPISLFARSSGSRARGPVIDAWHKPGLSISFWNNIQSTVENKGVWPTFKAVFNIPEPGEKGQAKNLKWMERINELRRIPAHPARERKYKVEDFEYIDFIYDELMKRLESSPASSVIASAAVAEAEDD